MKTPTAYEVELGKFVRAKFGQSTKIVRFADDDEKNDVYIATGHDHPIDGVTSYGSIGLSNHEQSSGSTPVRVEIVAACASSTSSIDNLVASCVFDSFKNSSNISYGGCISDVVSQYGISNTLKHVTFVAPFLWDDFDRITLGDRIVHCLLMLPISDAERDYLTNRGIDALERIFDEKQIDIYDINRRSAL